MTTAAKILDPCYGSRMFWFDKDDQRALFGDIRDEQLVLCDGRVLNVEPDVIMDFRSLPFKDGAFKIVVFDPPHLSRAGRDSWLRAKYGLLTDDWSDDWAKGFAECFRVLTHKIVRRSCQSSQSHHLTHLLPLKAVAWRHSHGN